jgi:prophage antirepressor-like protein
MSNTNSILLFFIFQDHDIRVVIHNDEPWFVAKDVCEALEINNASLAINGNPSRNETGLDEDEKGIYLVNTLGGPQDTLCINEPGLYRLIAKSHKPEAKTFQRWVYHEVLPAIRKTGRYSLKQEEPQKPHDQLSLWLNWDPTLLRALSRDECMCLIQYERTRLSFLETFYNSKYPQIHNNMYPQQEHRPHQTETLVLSPVETMPNLQTILLDYLQKTESVTVRHLQQSGPRQLRNLPADQLRTMLQTMVENGVLKIVQIGKAEGYQLL